MARQRTSGFELNDVGSTGTNAYDWRQASGSGSLPTISTANPRTGTYHGRCDSTAGNLTSWWTIITTNSNAYLASLTHYLRVYVNCSAFGTLDIWRFAGTTAISVRQVNTGAYRLWNQNTNTQIGSDSVTTTINTYNRLELSFVLDASSNLTDVEFKLNGAVVANTSGLSLAISTAAMIMGWISAPGASKIMDIDDFAHNDSSGANQNNYPGDGKVVLLAPTADSAGGTGWTLGTGTALGGNGFAAVDNEPPVGVADLTAGSDPKQIRNAAAAANSNYDATMSTYTAAGVPSGAVVKVITPIVSTAAPVVTSAKQGTVGVVSNPTIANVALGAAGTAGAFWSGVAAGAYPTGWKWSDGTITYNPSVTLGTAPVMRITQVTSSTRIAMVDSMGMYVEYTIPAVTHGPSGRTPVMAQARGNPAPPAIYA